MSDLFDELLADVPRGRNAEHIGQPPNAYFEHPRNIAATQSLQFDPQRNAESKIFLGVVGGNVVTGQRAKDGRVPRWVEGGVPIGVADDRHHFLLAGSRGGKGRSALINNLICLPRETSLLATDTKGELSAHTARWRGDGLGQEVAVTDAFNCSGSATTKYRKGFNPVELLTRSHELVFHADAMQIADALVIENGSANERHWCDCAREWIAGLCAHVATHNNYAGRRDLVTVWELAARADEPDPRGGDRYALESEMLGSDAGSGSVRTAAHAFYGRTGGEFSSVSSNARRHLSFIGIKAVQDILRGPSVDPRKLKSGSLAWYLVLPATRAHMLQGLQRLVVQLSLTACEDEPELHGNQGVFMLDEFHSLGRLESIETAIAQFAGLGVKLMVVLQDLSQIQKSYPKSWQTFLANAGTLQVFAGNDDATLSYVSKRLGEAMTVSRSSHLPSRDQSIREGATGASWAIGNKPLMTPSEIERFFARDDALLRQLVLRPGFNPMILQRAFYDKSEYFRDKFDARRM